MNREEMEQKLSQVAGAIPIPRGVGGNFVPREGARRSGVGFAGLGVAALLSAAVVVVGLAGFRHGSTRGSANPPSAIVPSPASPTARVRAGVIWNGDLAAGDLSQFAGVQDCSGPVPPQGVHVVSSPVRPGYRYSAAFTVTDSSARPTCPRSGAPSPNAVALGPSILKSGDDVYIGFSTYFPSDFPQDLCRLKVAGCFFKFAQIYGRPFGGQPPITFVVRGNRMALLDQSAQVWTAPSPLPLAAWQDIVIHVRFSTDSSSGLVELWLNGQRQTFLDGTATRHQTTLIPGDNWDGKSPNYLVLAQEHQAASGLGTLTIYHAAARIAATYAGAAP